MANDSKQHLIFSLDVCAIRMKSTMVIFSFNKYFDLLTVRSNKKSPVTKMRQQGFNRTVGNILATLFNVGCKQLKSTHGIGWG